MEKRRSLLYSLIASLAVTALIGVGALKRVDKWAQDSLFQQPGVTSGDIVTHRRAALEICDYTLHIDQGVMKEAGEVKA